MPVLGSSMAELSARLTAALADRYRIERELGAGGMATVYLAADLKHNRRVAIKVLHEELSSVLGPERFLKEIALTANLQHPHILPLFDSGSTDGLLYYVMPYVEGATVRGRLEREQQLPIADAVRIATEVADALDYAHRRGVIHRDIKPENILLHEGRVQVADFGIALAVQQAGGSRMTQTGLSLGTPQYMAPEQAMGDRVIDGRADIFALGAVTYEMLSGEPPFTGPNGQAIVARVMTERPRPLRAVRETVPPEVVHAVDTALAKLPADRFATAADFARALVGPAVAWPRSDAHGARVGGPGPWKPLALTALPLAVVASTIALWGWGRRGDSFGALPVALSVSLPPAIAVQPQPRLAVSPDGSRLVFVAEAAGKSSLYLRELTDVAVHAIPGTEGATDPFFSADGRRIGYTDAGALWTVALSGGAPEQIPGTNDGSIDPGAGIDGATWTAGDTILYAPRFRIGSGILSVPATGGTPRAVAVPDTVAGQIALSQPQLLPGGRSLLTIVAISGLRERRVGLVLVATHRVQLLKLQAIVAHYTAGHLVYTPGDGAVFVVGFDPATGTITGVPARLPGPDGLIGASLAVSDAGTLVYAGGTEFGSHLVEVDRAGRPHPLDDSARSYDVPRVSPDGAHIAVGIGAPAGLRDIWILDVSRRNLTRLTFTGDNIAPIWSPDGRQIAFAASVAGSYDILARPVSGTGPVDTLVSGREFHFPGAYSPDARWLVYRQNDANTNEDLYAISLDGHHTVRQLVASPFTEISPALSPDGRWLAYVSDESGRREIYVRAFDGSGGPSQISVAGGDEPRWAPSGRELYYRTPDSLFAVPVNAGPQGVAAGKPVALFADPYRHSVRYTDYDVLPNGSGFVMLAPRPDAGIDLRVVTGWPVLLGTARRQ
jgi:Tol biopolymer transport system component/tRNA A-37 threonylcarbamoyl transferase component Bud32